MTIEIISGDLLDAFDRGDVNVIGHVVNCQGKMNSGIAKSIRERYPDVYNHYISSDIYLGKMAIIELPPYNEQGKFVANLYAQQFYGYDGKRYLNYGAISHSLSRLRGVCSSDDKIGFPYKMGCDRAGGDWSIVLEMIEFYFKDHEVKIYKLDK